MCNERTFPLLNFTKKKKTTEAKMHPYSRYNAKGRILFCTGYHFIAVLTKLQMSKHFFCHSVCNIYYRINQNITLKFFRVKVSAQENTKCLSIHIFTFWHFTNSTFFTFQAVLLGMPGETSQLHHHQHCLVLYASARDKHLAVRSVSSITYCFPTTF